MITVRYFFTLIFAIIATAVLCALSGCGGGGSSDEPEYPEARLYKNCTDHVAPCNG